MIDIQGLFDLPRPEYAKQTEMVLVDLLWRSKGTILGEKQALQDLPLRRKIDRAATRRLIVKSLRQGNRPRSGDLTETGPWAEQSMLSGAFSSEADARMFTAAALGSVEAPKARRDQSTTCVPVHLGLIPLQSLSGAVNKDQPPDLAKAVEVMAALGGSATYGSAAARLVQMLQASSNASDLDRTFEAMGRHVWQQLEVEKLPSWPGTLSATVPLSPVPDGQQGACAHGPAGWFWTSWQCLLDPAAGWRDALPDRRFVDWATCVLRTGLAMTYLWEGAMFRALRDFIAEPTEPSWERLAATFRRPELLRIARPGTPLGERNINPLLLSGLGDGYHARQAVEEAVREARGNGTACLDLDADAATNAAALADLTLSFVDEVRPDPRSAPKTLREFVTYLMLARIADDAPADEADLYYLARRNRQYAWVEPGPEWLVVVASLAAGRPGGQCTLRTLSTALRSLGISVDRTTLVGLLEGAGLTQDSPDADEAIIVNAGF